jgi:hypothetical protein
MSKATALLLTLALRVILTWRHGSTAWSTRKRRFDEHTCQLLDYAPLEHQQRRLESGMTHHDEVVATDRLRRALLAFQTARSLYLGADPAA